MTFSASGSAFGGRRALAADAPCPCGGAAYGSCCGPVLAGEPAATAEALMRSRFTAFALGDAAHLRETWHPSTRPDTLDLDPGLSWLSLSVDDAVAGRAGDTTGVVEFRARWRDDTGERGTLQERSRFVFQRRRWWYVDGDLAGGQNHG